MFPIHLETFPIQNKTFLNRLETNVNQIMLCGRSLTMKCFSAASIGKGVTEESPMRSGNGFIADSLFRGLTICGLPSSAGLDPRTVTDGPIIEGEEEQKVMATLLKRKKSLDIHPILAT